MTANLQTWQNVLLQWVNCLGLQETSIENIKQLGDGRIFVNILKISSGKSTCETRKEQADEDITTFLKTEYPNYCMDEEPCEMKDEIEITYIASLVLYHCVVYFKSKTVVERMFHLTEDAQRYITHFLSFLLEKRNVTRNILEIAIYSYDSVAVPLSPKVDEFRNTTLNYCTPKRTLQDIYESPLAQKTKELSDKRLEIRRLNEDLEVEQREKFELQEQLQKQQEKTKLLTKQLNEKNQEIKKLRDEWLCSDYDSHLKSQGDISQEQYLNKKIKNLESYTSSIEAEMSSLQQDNDNLQEKLAKAEQQCAFWQTKYEEYESASKKLQNEVEHKESELSHLKELCSDLQNHVQRLKSNTEHSVEEDTSMSWQPTSPNISVCSPENMGDIVVDIKLREMEEENKRLAVQTKTMIVEQEEMVKCISDLECRLDIANQNINSLKSCKLELENKVDAMTSLQHDLGETERKLNNATIEIDHLAKERNLLEQQLASLQDLLVLKDSELSDCKCAADSLFVDLTGLQEKFEEKQKILIIETERVARLEREAIEAQKQLKLQSQEIMDIKTVNVEVQQNLELIDKSLEENVNHIKDILILDNSSCIEDTEPEISMSTNADMELKQVETLSAVCLSIKTKVQRLNYLLTELDAKNLETLNTKSHLESTCQQLNENIKKLHAEITELKSKGQIQLTEKNQLEECLQKADENIIVLQTKISEYVKEIDDLTAVLEEKKNVIEQLEKVKQSFSDKSMKLEEENHEIKLKIEDIKSELIGVKENKNHIEELYYKLLDQSEQQTKTVTNLNICIESLNIQINELLEERDFSNKNIEEISNKLQGMKESKDKLEQLYARSIKESEETITSLNFESNMLKSRIVDLEKKILICDTKVASLEDNLEEISRQKDILKEKYEVDSQENSKHVELLNEQLSLLKSGIVTLENEKKSIEGELEDSRWRLSETINKNENDKETFNKHLFKKDEIINNLKMETQNEIAKLAKEKEIAYNELETTKAKLKEVSANRDELQYLFEKENKEYNKKLQNLADKLEALTNKYKDIEQEKNTMLTELSEKENELVEVQENYKILRDETNQLEQLTKNQKEQLKITSNKIEELIQEKKEVTVGLETVENELVNEKKLKESLSEELVNKQKCLVSITEETNSLQYQIAAITEDRNVLQSTLQKLTNDLENFEAANTNLLSSYNYTKLENERITAVKLELEQQILDLEREKCSLSNALDTAKSDLLLYKQEQEEMIGAHNKQIEETKEEISQLNFRASNLQEEIYTLESDKKELIAHLEAARLEISELHEHNEQLEQLTNKIKAENETLENLKLCMDDKIKQLQEDRNNIFEELEHVKVSLQAEEESKEHVIDHYARELDAKFEQINKLSKETSNLQKSLDEITQEKKNLEISLIVTKSELEKIEVSKDELLREHTKQLQENEENIKNVHKNAVEIKTMFLKRIEEVEVERDVEKKLRIKVEELLEQEKENMEAVISKMDILVSEKEMISKLCTDIQDNIYSLRQTMQSLQEKERDMNTQQPVDISMSECSVSEERATDSLHVLFDCKKKLPSKPWNLDGFDVNVCSNKLSSRTSEQSDSTLSQDSSCLAKSVIPLDSKPADMKITMLESQTDSDEITSIRRSEIVTKLENLNTDLSAAREEIMSVMKSNDILRSELLRTEKKCNDTAQKYDQLAVTNDVLKAENMRLLKCIEGLNNLKSLLEESEKDLTNERTLKEKIKLEKEALQFSYDSLKTEVDKLNETNIKLVEKIAEYENCQLKIEEESSKLRKVQQQVESEFENLYSSLDNIKCLISGFKTKLKCINAKYEALVLNMSINCDELGAIEQQKSKLDKLFILLHIEYDQISQDVVKFAYGCLKETNHNNSKLHQLMTNVKSKDLFYEFTNSDDQLGDLKFQINALVSGIEIALLECSRLDSQCMNILKNHANEIEHTDPIEQILSSADRVDLIKSLVTKIQDSHRTTVIEKIENDLNLEDSLEMQSQNNNFEADAVEHGALLVMRLQFDQELKSKTEEIKGLYDQNTSLSKQLSNEHDSRAELEVNLLDLKRQNKSIISEKNSLAISKADVEDKCSQLEQKLLKMSEMKQAYETLLDENFKLQVEIEERKNKLAKMELHIEEKMKAVRQEYEKKLDRLKDKMRILYDEEVEKKMKKMKDECDQMQVLCRDYKDKIKSYQQEIAFQQSHIWELGDKLLLSDKEKKKLQEELIKRQDAMLERLDFKKKPDAKSSDTTDIIDESITYIRRKKSVLKSLPSGMGQMFSPEDEEGEMFNTTNLADLKAGRCVVAHELPYKGRISELQYRNSLCPPHLKSSYPAETQFHHPREYKDDDLKLGCAMDQENLDTLSTNMLLPTEKQRKKDRGQTSYKKPGPPTPGKSGGRLSLQGTEVLTPRAPLRESNDGACVRKASTPSRLKSLFTSKNRHDENIPLTPHGRRLSNFFRRQVKIHQ